MFSLFRKNQKTSIRENRVPQHCRVYAVGDIHGRLDLLEVMLEHIRHDASLAPADQQEIVFLGDYVDRGLHSRGVLARLRQGVAPEFTPVFLRGNHEDVMLRFYDGDFSVALDWFYFGGRETLASYGLPPPPPNVAKEKIPDIHQAFVANIPAEDVAFLRATRLHHVCGDYTFVHAGLRPGLGLEQQLREDLLFIRSDFLRSDDDFGTMVVHGHTIVEAPEVKHNRIGIDTGAYATGRLTCLVLEGSEYRFMQT